MSPFVFHDPLWCEDHLWIYDKRGKLIPLRYNSPQWRLNGILAEEVRQGKPVRLIVLKARQEGCSTWWESVGYSRTAREAGLRGLVLSHDPEGTGNLYMMYRTYYEHDPQQLPTLSLNMKGLRFAHGGQVLIQTAAKRFAGSGQTYQFVHFSEQAKWPFPQETSLSVLQSVAGERNTMILNESTAYGAGNYFHEEWQAAIRGDSEWRAIFLPWYEHDEYRRNPMKVGMEDFGKDERFNVYEGQEDDLLERYQVTSFQLAWRRWCIKANCGGSPLLFQQEYPSCLTGEMRVSTEEGIICISEAGGSKETESGPIRRWGIQPPSPIYRLTTKGGRILRGTADHPVMTDSGLEALAVLAPGQSIALQKPRFASANHVERWNGPLGSSHQIEVGEALGRFIGYFMGDGSWHKGQLSFVCDAKDEDVVSDVADLVRRFIGEPRFRSIGRVQGRRGAIEVRKGCLFAQPMMARLGLIGQNGSSTWRRDVGVPRCIWRSPGSVVREFLRGLFEADGSASGRIVRWATSKEAFARDIQMLLIGFGIPCSISTNKKKAGNGSAYTSYVIAMSVEQSRIFHRDIGFVGERKRGLRPASPGKCGRPPKDICFFDEVANVAQDGFEETFDFCMDTPTHLFGAQGILTHNTSEEAFLSGGTPRFDVRVLQRWYDAVEEPQFIGRTELRLDDKRPTTELIGDESGWLRIWSPPEAGERYTIFGDCAGEDPAGDENTACVLRISRLPWRQVATLHGLRGADRYGRALANVGYFYGCCVLGWEVNGVGEAMQSHLRHWYPEAQMYHRLPIDKATRHPSQRIGWYTGRITRHNIIEDLDAGIRDETLEVPDEATVLELLSFQRVPGQRNGEHKPGSRDDRVFALGGAVQIASYSGAKEYENWDPNRHRRSSGPMAVEA